MMSLRLGFQTLRRLMTSIHDVHEQMLTNAGHLAGVNVNVKGQLSP